jgi:hypothetical protein
LVGAGGEHGIVTHYPFPTVLEQEEEEKASDLHLEKSRSAF